MACTVSYEVAAKRVELRVEGELTPADMRRATHEALDLVTHHDCLGVLVDCRKLHPAPLPSSVQRLPEMYAARNADRRIRIAVVISGSENGRGVSQYFKMSARRQDYTVELFEDIDDASTWLCEEAGCLPQGDGV